MISTSDEEINLDDILNHDIRAISCETPRGLRRQDNLHRYTSQLAWKIEEWCSGSDSIIICPYLRLVASSCHPRPCKTTRSSQSSAYQHASWLSRLAQDIMTCIVTQSCMQTTSDTFQHLEASQQQTEQHSRTPLETYLRRHHWLWHYDGM